MNLRDVSIEDLPIVEILDCLLQWQNAEMTNDLDELNNARYNRDQILKPLKEQANAQSTEREATPGEQSDKAGGQVEGTGIET